METQPDRERGYSSCALESATYVVTRNRGYTIRSTSKYEVRKLKPNQREGERGYSSSALKSATCKDVVTRNGR